MRGLHVLVSILISRKIRDTQCGELLTLEHLKRTATVCASQMRSCVEYPCLYACLTRGCDNELCFFVTLFGLCLMYLWRITLRLQAIQPGFHSCPLRLITPGEMGI